MYQTPNNIFARQCVLFALLIAFIVNIPLLFLTTLFWDDWAWLWVIRTQGAAAFQDYTWQFAHPMYGPVINLIFWLGGDSPGRLARTISLASHLGSGWLIWKIFQSSGVAFSATLTTLFLLAPFLAVRVMAVFATYDFFIFLYLLSIWLSGLNNPRYLLLATPAIFIGLGNEPMASLSLFAGGTFTRGYRSRELFLRCSPFASIVLIVAPRVTWLTTYGGWTSYNKIAFRPIETFALLDRHLRYFIKGIIVVSEKTVDLVRNDSIIFSAFCCDRHAVASMMWRIKENVATREPHRTFTLWLAPVFLLGVLFICIDQPSSSNFTHFSSRFAVASQFVQFIAIALLINVICWRAIRSAAMFIAVVTFAGTQLQFGKSALV